MAVGERLGSLEGAVFTDGFEEVPTILGKWTFGPPIGFDSSLHGWEEMSRLFRKELFNEKGEINREYLVNFRGIKELPANLVKDQFLVVNRDFGYFLSYLKAIDLVLEYHRHAQIVRKEILCSLSESYAGNNLCVNYRGVRLSLRLLFHSIMVENITSNIAFPTSKRTINLGR